MRATAISWPSSRRFSRDPGPGRSWRGRARAERGGDWLAAHRRGRRPRAALRAGAALVVAAEAVALAFPVAPVERYVPAAAVRAAVAAAGIAGPVLNDYNYGDYLMFAGIKTFIDGRADMFGDPFIKRYYEATHGMSDRAAGAARRVPHRLDDLPARFAGGAPDRPHAGMAPPLCRRDVRGAFSRREVRRQFESAAV